mmetsp:Transcript_17694/g.37357  ORF Transcript_17694/g.37357 Transcript_17694/m.37357 type:complete len:456 (+) Transcript_17694:88-1455(+)
MMPLKLCSTIVLLASIDADVSAASNSKSFHELQSRHQPPSAADIRDSLDEYDAFYIQVKPASSGGGPCVWSECGVDDTDDQYTGDNRDGDEQWYQFRTQNFCANAAYSLYGRKKGDGSSWLGRKCSGSHYINSFFTYGGADNLLAAVGKTPNVYFADSGAYTNADCVEDTSNNGNNNNHQRRRLNSGSGDRSHSSGDDGATYNTIGCSATGQYILGQFSSSTCDGNYFTQDIGSFDEYNAQFTSGGHMSCHKLHATKDYDALYNLLANSWECDVRVYPNQCPDPYQRKARYEYALRTAARGGNGMAAYRQMVVTPHLRRLSWALLGLAGMMVLATYFIQKRYGGKKIAPVSSSPSSPDAAAAMEDESKKEEKSLNESHASGGSIGSGGSGKKLSPVGKVRKWIKGKGKNSDDDNGDVLDAYAPTIIEITSSSSSQSVKEGNYESPTKLVDGSVAL